jgi:hypothetical protein
MKSKKRNKNKKKAFDDSGWTSWVYGPEGHILLRRSGEMWKSPDGINWEKVKKNRKARRAEKRPKESRNEPRPTSGNKE